jgi:hypothetical protein
MDLERTIESLQRELHTLFKARRAEDAAKLILDSRPLAQEAIQIVIPPSAMREMRMKFRFGNNGVLPYNDDLIPDNRREEIHNKRYTWEHKLLEAHVPKVVARRWEEAKPKLEQRYGRQFAHRRDLAIMNNVYFQLQRTEEEFDELRQTYSRFQNIKRFAKGFPYGKEILDLWSEHSLGPSAQGTGDEVLTLLMDLRNPEELVDDDYLTDGLVNSSGGPDFNYYNGRGLRDDDLWQLTIALFEEKSGALSFRKALSLLQPSYAKTVGLASPVPSISQHDHLSLKQSAESVLSQRYAQRTQDEDVVRFLQWYSGTVLQRWSATAPDYQNLLFDNQLSRDDERLVRLFYYVREGKETAQDDERVHKGKLPRLLQTLVQDNVISEDAIIPTLPSSVPAKNLEARLASLPSFRSAPLVDTSHRLPAREQARPSASTALVTNELKDYQMIYRGQHVLLLAKIGAFPMGDPRFLDVYSASPVRTDIDLQGLPTAQFQGQTCLLRKKRDAHMTEQARHALGDIAADITYLKAFTGIVDMPYEQFVESHFRDLVAHALIFTSSLDTQYALLDLNLIHRFNPEDTEIAIGERNRVSFKTRKLGDKFSFSIEGERESVYDDVVAASASIVQHLQDVGVPFRAEAVVDEYGRKVVQQKLEARSFRASHLSEVIEALRGDNLAQLILDLGNDSRYQKFHVGSYNAQCEHCGRPYVSGDFYRPDLGEQWFDGVDGKDLHDLSCHPDAYHQERGSLEKIHRMLNDVKKSDQMPVLSDRFTADKEAIGLLLEFRVAYDNYNKADRAATNFWEATCGGIREDDEEIEADPELKELRDEETRLYRNESAAMTAAKQVAAKLSGKLKQIDGVQRTFEGFEEYNFWAKQLQQLDKLRITAPHLLGPYVGTPLLEEGQD